MPNARDKQLTQSGAQVQKLLNAIQPPVGTVQPVTGMLPNILYNFGVLEGDTTFLLAPPEDAMIINHYYWMFETGETAPTITFPAEITSWNGGEAPEIEAGHHYEISVLNGIGAFMDVELPSEG